jgi:hypothetical protein
VVLPRRRTPPAGHVPCLGGLDGCVHQSLPAGHGVEEKLCGRQAGVEAVGHKPLACGGFVAPGEMWQGAVLRALDTPSESHPLNLLSPLLHWNLSV